MQLKNKTLSKKVLLDSSALLALLKKEPGYKIVEDILATSAISAVNLSEIISVLSRSGVAENDIDDIINELIPEIINFTTDIAISAGKLIKTTNKHGLSFGDRACIATAITHNMLIYTTDKAWINCNIVGAEIILLR